MRILWMRGTRFPERRGHPSFGRRARARHAGSGYLQPEGRRRGVLIVLNVRVIEAVASSHAEGVDSSLTWPLCLYDSSRNRLQKGVEDESV